MKQEMRTISHKERMSRPFGASHTRPGHGKVLFDGLSSERVHYKKDPGGSTGSSDGGEREPNRFEAELREQGVSLDIPARFLDVSRLPADAVIDRLTGLPIEEGAHRLQIIEDFSEAIRAGQGVAFLYADVDQLKTANNIDRNLGDMAIKQGAAQVLQTFETLDLPEEVKIYAVRQTGAADETVVLFLNVTDEQIQQIRGKMREVERQTRITNPEFTFSTSAALLTSADIELQEGISITQQSLQLHPDAMAYNLYNALHERADDATKILKIAKDISRLPIEPIGREEFSDRIRVILKDTIKNSRVSEPLIDTVLTIMQQSSYMDLLSTRANRERMMAALNITPERQAQLEFTDEDLRVLYYDALLHYIYDNYNPILRPFELQPETDRRESTASTTEPENPYESTLREQGVDVTIPSRFLDVSRLPADAVIDRLTGLPIEEGALRLQIIEDFSEAIRAGRKVAMLYADVDQLKTANNVDRNFGDMAIKQSAAQVLQALEVLGLSEEVKIYAVRQTGAADETVVLFLNVTDEQIQQIRGQMKVMARQTSITGPEFTFSTSAALVTSDDEEQQAEVTNTQQFLRQHPDAKAFNLYNELHTRADDETKILKIAKDITRMPIRDIGREEFSTNIRIIIKDVLKNSRVTEPLVDTALAIMQKSSYMDLLSNVAGANREGLMRTLNLRLGDPAHESYTDEELRTMYYRNTLLFIYNTYNAHNN